MSSDSSCSVLVSTFAPFPTLSLSVPSDTPFDSLYDILNHTYPSLPSLRGLVLSTHSNRTPPPSAPLSSLTNDTPHPISLRLSPRILGGKGGFGSQLRAAGGRMSSQKTSNNDSCRDLSGRRLSTIKEAKKLAEYIESEPTRKKAEQEAKKAKLEALERKLGISKDGDSAESKKRRFDDTEYLEQSQEIVDNVKNAVAAALLKKKKKAKLAIDPVKPTVTSGAAKAVEKSAVGIVAGPSTEVGA